MAEIATRPNGGLGLSVRLPTRLPTLTTSSSQEIEVFGDLYKREEDNPKHHPSTVNALDLSPVSKRPPPPKERHLVSNLLRIGIDPNSGRSSRKAMQHLELLVSIAPSTHRGNKQFFGHDKEDPHAHIRYFNKITSTMRVPNVPIATIKLMLFPFSIEGAARIWLEKEPPRSIQTWGRSSGGKLFWTNPRNVLKIIESKSKVRQTRAKAVVAKVSTNSSTQAVSSDVAELKDIVRALLLDKKNQASAPAPLPCTCPKH
ncbi:hypothetical protein Tco_0876912 [Tanacetum coccineum]|uniref:Reverse transcriptase domain-containing protein n=1 Tax=Tanacetum coccineum TaxID=301880 RepID=A0ABQ5BTV9_9ASTR